MDDYCLAMSQASRIAGVEMILVLFVSFIVLVNSMTSVTAAKTAARGKLPRLVAFDLDGTYVTSSCIHNTPFTSVLHTYILLNFPKLHYIIS